MILLGVSAHIMAHFGLIPTGRHGRLALAGYEPATSPTGSATAEEAMSQVAVWGSLRWFDALNPILVTKCFLGWRFRA